MVDPSSEASVFHRGERAVQERLGVRDVEGWARKIVRPYLPEQHRQFYRELPYLVVAARDEEGRAWATLLAGPPGFVSSPSPTTLRLAARPVAGDALEHALTGGADLGLLGIALSSRRRNRANGRVAPDGDGLLFTVDQSFGNCPQYIHERAWRWAHTEPGPVTRTDGLRPFHIDGIERADTFFIASGYRGRGDDPRFGMDASHRGGEPGFAAVESPRRIVFPDYAGNNHFNTIGNLLVDPRVGVTFVDFATGGLLQITGRATVDFDSEAVAAIPGARRLVVVDIEEVVDLPAALPLRWDGDGDSVRSLRVVDKVRESEDVTSFVLKARDGGPLPDFEAGQHLPLELAIDGLPQPVRRTYSLSNGPGEGRYRLTIKREPKGLVSRLLHDHVAIGAVVGARRPAGDFVLAPGDHPAVLVSAGVGLTPMVSMLHVLADPSRSAPVWFFHGARDGAHHPLGDEVRRLAGARDGITTHVRYSRPRPEDGGHDAAGRLDGATIAEAVDRFDAHYYLCGPVAFMAAVQSELEHAGVAPERIHSESFGPRGR